MHPRLIKNAFNYSRIVPDTEYKNNLRTINLKINMLVHTCYLAVETLIWSKENIFHKMENVFLSFFKNGRTQLAVFVI